MKILPQTYAVKALILAAQEALELLPLGVEKACLEGALKEFEDCTVLTSWHIVDVAERRPDLTPDECREVLADMYRGHGCNEYDWEFLEICADCIKPRPAEEDL